MSDNPVPLLMSPEALAKSFGVSSTLILKWYHAGIIPAEVAEGKIYRFDAVKVRAALAKRINQPKPETA